MDIYESTVISSTPPFSGAKGTYNICPEWRRILSVQYMAKQLGCRILYTWLQ